MYTSKVKEPITATVDNDRGVGPVITQYNTTISRAATAVSCIHTCQATIGTAHFTMNMKMTRKTLVKRTKREPFS